MVNTVAVVWKDPRGWTARAAVTRVCVAYGPCRTKSEAVEGLGGIIGKLDWSIVRWTKPTLLRRH